MFRIFKKKLSTGIVPQTVSKPVELINIHDQFVNLLMKDGKKAKAAALVHETFIALKTKFPNDSPMDLLTRAVSKASPLLKLVSKKRGSKSIQVPMPLTIPQQRRFGILWIINGAKKRSVKETNSSKYVFGRKLAEEIIGVLQGSALAIEKKKELYTHALQNKGNIVMNSSRR